MELFKSKHVVITARKSTKREALLSLLGFGLLGLLAWWLW